MRKYGVKWSIWLLILVATGGVWVFYFTDVLQLVRDFVAFDVHLVAWWTIGILTVMTFLFGGFFCEQICIYACFWLRI